MQSLESGIGTARVENHLASRFARHKVSAAVLAGLLVIVGLATAWNLEGWPGRVDDDEGTYVAQAWAVVYEHTITHYSYWYDHPPLGWVQIGLFGWVTDGFNRVAAAVFVGRQFMWCLTLVGCVLLYVLCRRLGMRRTTSAITVALFGLSPLGQFFHRLVSLDNIATVWVLGALVAATSPRRGWRRACLAGACAAIAVLSKETAIFLVPVIAWVLWQHTCAVGDERDPAADGAVAATAERPGEAVAVTEQAVAEPIPRARPDAAAETSPADPAGTAPDGAEAAPVWMPDFRAFAGRHSTELTRLRGMASNPGTLLRGPAVLHMLPRRVRHLLVFAVTGCVIVALYPVYALQRGQLPLMWDTLWWQFSTRPGSGSLLDPNSGTYAVARGWVSSDPWLLVTGFIAAIALLLSRRLRPFAVALLLQIVVLVKGGYLPFFYVTEMLPFAALAIGGAADTLWDVADPEWLTRSRGSLPAFARRWRGSYLGPGIVAVVALLFAAIAVPSWVSQLNTNSTANGDAPYLAAVSWAKQNVAKGDTVAVDDYLWVDLKRQGLNPLWIWKIDPQTAPDGWKSIDYIILQPQSPGTLAGMPALQGAYAHSVLVKDFGNGLTVRRVTGG
ncbi:MAG TPA: glycosyltransferase family 39 protein [Trebonia sp.]|nr:glycosyltransferase family 39 protein [Trebonia sp.]